MLKAILLALEKEEALGCAAVDSGCGLGRGSSPQSAHLATEAHVDVASGVVAAVKEAV